MLRRFCSALCGNAINFSSNIPKATAPKLLSLVPIKNQQLVNFSALAVRIPTIPSYAPPVNQKKLLLEPKLLVTEQKRTVIKFNLKTGKRRVVKPVIHRYYRLHWGGWIRVRSGRHTRLYKKSAKRRLRYYQHVFFNARQCHMLEKMIINRYRKRRYYPEDPYEPYHEREYYYHTRKKPCRPEGVDYE